MAWSHGRLVVKIPSLPLNDMEVGAEDIERSPKRVVEWGASDVVPHFHDGAGYHPMWAQEHYKHCLYTFTCTVHIHFARVLYLLTDDKQLHIGTCNGCENSESVIACNYAARSGSPHLCNAYY